MGKGGTVARWDGPISEKYKKIVHQLSFDHLDVRAAPPPRPVTEHIQTFPIRLFTALQRLNVLHL